jgi:hypothetical protein
MHNPSATISLSYFPHIVFNQLVKRSFALTPNNNDVDP